MELIEELLQTLVSLSNASSETKKKYPSMTNFPQQQLTQSPSSPQTKPSLLSTSTNSSDESSLSSSNSSSYSKINSSPAQTAAQLWGLFKKHYLRLLFPMTARRYNMTVANGEGRVKLVIFLNTCFVSQHIPPNPFLFSSLGFATCPTEVLHTLINFYVRNCIEQVSTPSSSGGFPGLTSSVSFLQNVLMGTELSHEFYHEVLRQALLLPYVHGEVTRGAIHIIRSWVSVPVRRRRK